MQKRVLVIVLDSVGCGGAADAAAYGDEGANTLGHLFEKIPNLQLQALASLGLYDLLGIQNAVSVIPGSKAFRLNETAAGKDTTSGHWELMGYRLTEPLMTYESFPDDLLVEIEMIAGTKFIGNKVASGTEIIKELGELHCATGKPILYTSADSVLQIAAHEETYGLEKLLALCQKVRAMLDRRGLKIGRVIARPFVGTDAETFRRTSNRHDYSLIPERTILNDLQDAGVDVIVIGKISDIFAGSGIRSSFPTSSNAEGMEKISKLWTDAGAKDHLIFANLVDFDSLYGHRRDPKGYAACLMAFDRWLKVFLERYKEDGLVIITADHGNDPFFTGTDHTREQVPCFVLSPPEFDYGSDMNIFSDVGRCVAEYFGLK